MFAHHHIQRERLSVGERMSEVLALLGDGAQFVPFQQLFRPEEGRMGVTRTLRVVSDQTQAAAHATETAPDTAVPARADEDLA